MKPHKNKIPFPYQGEWDNNNKEDKIQLFQNPIPLQGEWDKYGRVNAGSWGRCEIKIAITLVVTRRCSATYCTLFIIAHYCSLLYIIVHYCTLMFISHSPNTSYVNTFNYKRFNVTATPTAGKLSIIINVPISLK